MRVVLLLILLTESALCADFGDIPSNLTLGAGTSVRRNAGNTAFESYTPGAGGSSVWGSITGTLSAQTDLQTALDGKQPLDGDLTALAALTGTNNIYYRSASNTWTSVTMGSNMTFSGGVLQSTVSGGGGGTVTSITATAPIVVTPSPIVNTGVISLGVADTTHNGYLSSTDWNTFNGKQNTITSSALTKSDDTNVTLSLGGSPTTALLGAVSVTVGWTGTLAVSRGGIGASTAPAHDYFGNNTGVTAAPGFHQIDYSELSGTPTIPTTSGSSILYGNGTGGFSNATVASPITFSGGVLGSTALTSNQTITLSGDVSGSGATAITTTIGNSKVTYAKMQNVSANSVLLGSSATGAAAPPSEIALGTNLSMSGSTLNATSGGGAVGGNPTAKVGTSVVNGSATTFMRSDAAPPIDQTIDLAMTAAQSETLSDSATNTAPDILSITHNSSATPVATFGTGLIFKAQDSSTASVGIGAIRAKWTTATHLSNSSDLIFYANSSNVNPTTVATIHGSSGIFDSQSGFQHSGITPATGKILQSDGAKYVGSTPIFPTGIGSAGTIVQSNGSTGYVSSTPTWPTTAGTAGYNIRSDGTNFASYPTQLINSSTTVQSPTTTDVYLTGSNVVVVAGDFKAKGQYRCLFDVTKSAGTGAIVLTLRVGTAGTTADAAILTFTFGAGTAVADTGVFEVIATWRTVGSGTSAVIQGSCRAEHNLTTTGLISNAATFIIVPAASSGFASNATTNIGVSFNGSTAFAGNIQSVQAILEQ